MGNPYTLEKGVPVNLEAERAVLGSILIQPDLYDEAAEFLTGEDFYLDAHRRIWKRISELREANRPVDMILLSDALDRNNEVGAIGGIAYLSSLIDGLPERLSIKYYVQIVKRKAILRGLINVAQQSISEAIEDAGEADDVVARTEAAITQLTEEVIDRKWATFKDSLNNAGGLDSYVNKILDPKTLNGIPTGYRKLDEIIGGLAPSTLVIIAARPSIGKSTLAVNLCDNITEANPELVIAFFALEMSREAMERRFLASMARVSMRSMVGQKWLEWDQQSDGEKLTRAVEKFLERRIFIDDTTMLTPMRLRSKCRQLKRKEGRMDLIVVDFLQLMTGGGKFENRTQEVSAISRGLKAIGKELRCPVVALSQMSRAVENRSDKRPILSDLRESGSIEQDADVIAFIHRPEVYSDDPDVHGLAEINVAKHRDGATGIAHLCFLAEYTRFENLAVV